MINNQEILKRAISKQKYAPSLVQDAIAATPPNTPLNAVTLSAYLLGWANSNSLYSNFQST